MAATIRGTLLQYLIITVVILALNLVWLYLDQNAFSGVVPWVSLSNCSLLQVIWLGSNVGFDPQGIPSWMGSVQNLQEIEFSRMNLQGQIPTEIGQLSQLSLFVAPFNNLSGVIPASLGNCTFLQSFDVQDNLLTGQVPPDLGHLSLSHLIISNNLFSPGPCPSFIFNLTASLEVIQVDSNQLHGKLDGDFGAFQQLRAFIALNNSFHGQIPKSFSNCSNLSFFILGSNILSGVIPLGLANLTLLRVLDVGSNHLNGSIHGELLRSFPLMESLDFSNNHFDGTIPVEIGQLVYLQWLNMSANPSAIVPT